MTDKSQKGPAPYYREAESWATDRERSRRLSQRAAWIVAAIATIIALFEAIALTALAPLKTVVPYTLMVDRQTGYIQALAPLARDIVAPDAALTRSFLAQYVIARETFDIDSLNEDFRKVALWSAGEARSRYLSAMQASNPQSPLASLPRRAIVQVEIRSISSLGKDASLVRFATIRTDPGSREQAQQLWAAVIKHRFSGAAMSAADRLINPLGFQVTRYRRDAELAPQTASMPPLLPPGSAPRSGQPRSTAAPIQNQAAP